MTDANCQIERVIKLADKGEGDDESLRTVPDHFVELAANSFGASEVYGRRLMGSLTGTTAEDIQFENGRFCSVDLSKTRWHKLLLREIRLDTCDLANARWTNAILDSIRLEKCRGTGLQLIDAKSTNAVFLHSKLNLTAFHGSRFYGNRFENCDLSEANFESVELTDVVFRNCDLCLARFPNCMLRNVDFRGSYLAGMQFDPAKLRGTCVDPAQLLDVAATMGLTVKSIEEPVE
jgi:uncharacterized protein YjbI with pentapeptide repeats